MEVSMLEILDAREQRVAKQKKLLEQFHKPLLCFTMNIAGPEKNNALITKGFRLGQRLLDAQLTGSCVKVVWQEESIMPTGCEGFYVVDTEPALLKKLAVQIEDSQPVCRLFDMDVLLPDGKKVSREDLGLPGRECLICGNPVHVCSRSRAHSVETLQSKTRELLTDALWQQDAQIIGATASKSLLYEVCTTPKPGLVDRQNSGSHKDMDIFTFMASTAALQPYFTDCARMGLETAQLPAAVTFEKIRFLGKMAEQTMREATGGINTHKGAIFTLGLLCAAAGRCDRASAAEICSQVAAMTQGLTEADKTQFTETTGQQLAANHGICGVRGLAEAGFPVLLEVGLPILEAGLSRGLTLEEAGCAALLHLMCAVTDTNLIARSDIETQQKVCHQVRQLLAEQPFPTKAQLEQLDAKFIGENLSPGGSADLLAAAYFLYFIKKDL